MMRYLLLFLACSALARAGFAPDSIANKVYRETYIRASLRSSSDRTIVFFANGRYLYLKAGVGHALNLEAPYKLFVTPPPFDGTYSYRRTSDTVASLQLTADDGEERTIDITFTNASGGETRFNSNQTSPDSTFTISDLTRSAAAPVVNLSMRGRVDANCALIVGFVVPGDRHPFPGQGFVLPPPGLVQREVLIRVVGPSLLPFGVKDVWANPRFQLFKDNGPADVNEVLYDDWSVTPYEAAYSNADTQTAFRKIFNYVGAFPLHADSMDAAAVVRLNPGAYTIVATAAKDDHGGEALIEVYFLP